MDRKVHPVKIFIGYDSTQPVAAFVLWTSLVVNSSRPLDIKFLNVKDLDFHRPHDPRQSTEFTYTRFLVPWLCEFKGRALFLDSDMICFSDITRLLDKRMCGAWIRCVQQTHTPAHHLKMGGKVQEAYPRKNWSSLMLLDNARLQVWAKDYVERASPETLHRFMDVPDKKIARLNPLWNVLDGWIPGTKILHLTSGGPWILGCEDHVSADLWWDYAETLGFGSRDGLVERWHDRARDFCEAKSAKIP